ncbi:MULTISPECIES: TetR family transcriptional regulator [unclassified Paenibacillus]|uniref:TetR family transcriptional regulator n=1 Tax=unclassified Paenibacillus TaxID=185978 RepID=UPI00070FA057|nr:MULTISPECIES: TetR family transcriptional regulator [unclassified Paenibacillus]KQX68295.1 TetR family transcriptional regulator [Paenibacillus sp. Root444D2]KRE32725.1 TetR family transcriptional regulator [Paenibacillus sp. Soil724D2]
MSNDLPLTKEAILDAAEQVLRRYGPDKTSVVDVAKALQVSHGTLYRHFASKASLREAVTERWLHKIILDPLETIASQSGGSAAERLRSWFETLIHTKRTYAINDSEMFTMYAAVTLEAVEMITTHVNQLIDQIARIIDEGMKSEEFKSVDSNVTAKAIFIATSRFHHPAHAKEWSSDTIHQEFASVWDLLLFGIS